MEQMIWKLCEIEKYIPYINKLFEKNKGHKHEDNYLKYPLFEFTKFSRMGFDNDMNMVYYSAGIERPEYNGSIRIMSRHTRDEKYFNNHSNWKKDLQRGIETLDLLTEEALKNYKDIWVSREESPKLLEYFCKNSKYNWKLFYETLHYGGKQYTIRLQ
tara:strand:+ start:539 stop:1012 length:474 start_codon:yes stop_codon:yes gene_type:complete